MKPTLIIALFAAALGAPFSAQAENAYVGASAGAIDLRIDSNNHKSHGNDAGFKVFGGYQFNQTFGAEAGLAALGDHDVSVSGVDGGHIKPSALYLAATATMPLTKEFSVFAKAGVSRNRSTFDLPGGTQRHKYNITTPLLGLGASYNITPALALVAEYENFGKVQDSGNTKVKAQMLSAGLRYKF